MEDEMLNNVNKPAHKRSIRDIPLPANKEDQRNKSSVDLRPKKDTPSKPKTKKVRKKNHNKSYFLIGVVVLFVVLIVTFANLLSRATVNIKPREFVIENADLTLDLIPVDEITEDAQLGYRVVPFSKTAETVVPANGEEMVQQKAAGVITVYNEFSESPQKLIRNTRFESEEGLIYRTPESIEVPGYEETPDGLVPGSLDIEVVADEVGQNYNVSGEMTFTIPGFRGQDAYEFFYAETKTNIDGGYNGVKKIVNESDLENAKSELNNSVRTMLEQEVENQIPNNVVALYSDESFNYGSVQQSDLDNEEVKLSIEGSLSVILVDKGELAASIAATKSDSGYRANEQVTITNFNEIEITLVDSQSGKEIKVRGPVKIKWVNDTNALSAELAGKNKNEFRNVISDYRGVVSVTTKFFPFWKNNFPENSEKIIINESSN